MCDKGILENGGILESVPHCYKNQQMCDKAVDNYLNALKFVVDLWFLRLKKCVIKLSILTILQML